MPTTNEWDGDWDEVATDHVFSSFRNMVAHMYYQHRFRLTELAQVMQSTHPEVTVPALREKMKLEDFPLREADKLAGMPGKMTYDILEGDKERR